MKWDAVLPLITAYLPALLVVGYGVMINNRRVDDLRLEMHRSFDGLNQKFESLEKLMTEKLLRVESVIDARLSHIEDKLGIGQ